MCVDLSRNTKIMDMIMYTIQVIIKLHSMLTSSVCQCLLIFALQKGVVSSNNVCKYEHDPSGKRKHIATILNGMQLSIHIYINYEVRIKSRTRNHLLEMLFPRNSMCKY